MAVGKRKKKKKVDYASKAYFKKLYAEGQKRAAESARFAYNRRYGVGVKYVTK